MEQIGLGERLKQLIEELGITQQQFAEELFISPSTLNGYIRNKRMPEYSVLRKISRRLGTSCDYLLGNEYLKTGDGEYLNESESRVIELFRKMDENGKDFYTDAGVYLSKKFPKNK